MSSSSSSSSTIGGGASVPTSLQHQQHKRPPLSWPLCLGASVPVPLPAGRFLLRLRLDLRLLLWCLLLRALQRSSFTCCLPGLVTLPGGTPPACARAPAAVGSLIAQWKSGMALTSIWGAGATGCLCCLCGCGVVCEPQTAEEGDSPRARQALLRGPCLSALTCFSASSWGLCPGPLALPPWRPVRSGALLSSALPGPRSWAGMATSSSVRTPVPVPVPAAAANALRLCAPVGRHET
jgi:hypothetical protein